MFEEALGTYRVEGICALLLKSMRQDSIVGNGDGLRNSEAKTALQVGGESARQLEDLRARDKNSEKLCQTRSASSCCSCVHIIFRHVVLCQALRDLSSKVNRGCLENDVNETRAALR